MKRICNAKRSRIASIRGLNKNQNIKFSYFCPKQSIPKRVSRHFHSNTSATPINIRVDHSLSHAMALQQLGDSRVKAARGIRQKDSTHRSCQTISTPISWVPWHGWTTLVQGILGAAALCGNTPAMVADLPRRSEIGSDPSRTESVIGLSNLACKR